MRLNRTLAIAASTLALATGTAFAGGDAMSPQEQQDFLSSMSPQEQQEFYGRSEAPLSDQSDPMGYQPYEVYDVYVVPLEEIVLIPLEQPGEAPISGNERG